LIRNTAAQQLADVQKQHPEELFNLLTRVVPFLRSKSWETRSAAAKAIGGIVENAEHFDPDAEDDRTKVDTNGHTVKREDENDLPPPDDQLQLETLDVGSIMKFGKPLLGSAGIEYDYQFIGMDPSERLAAQKKSLVGRLGLGGEYIEDDLVTIRDIETPKYPLPGATPKLDTALPRRGSGLASPATPQTPGAENLSSRQLNALKRKKKLEMKQQANKVRVIDFSERKQSTTDYPQTPATAQPVAIKTEPSGEERENGVGDYFSLDRRNGDDDSKLVTEFKGEPIPEKSVLATEAEDEGNEWPFDRLCEFLSVDLFDHAWETRHGAAMGLREVIRVHGAGAGRRRGKTKKQNENLNRRWLEDLACRLCCVFMLDRFGDYSSEGVVVPVRETAGQALGAVVQHLPPGSVKAVFGVLRRLVGQDGTQTEKAWQSCHGGILGMRYVVAVRNDLLLKESDLLDGVLDAVLKCLGDEDDDVRAVSAATLIPVADEVVSMKPEILGQLITIIWDCISNLSDDLSSSTGSVMDLLAKLCSYPAVLSAMKVTASEDPERSFARLVPRLYPFLRHTIPGVRSAVLRALLTFLGIEEESAKAWIDGKILRLCFQNLLVERVENVLQLSLEVWNALVDSLTSEGPGVFADEFTPNIEPLITLTTSPIGSLRRRLGMEPTLFIRPSGSTYMLPDHAHSRRKSPSQEPPKKRQRKSATKENSLPVAPVTSHNIDTPMLEGDIQLVGAEVIMRSRIFAAQAMGKAIASWPASERTKTFSSRIAQALQSPSSSTRIIAAMITEEFGKRAGNAGELGTLFVSSLHAVIDEKEPMYYRDLVEYLKTTQSKCQALLNTFKDEGRVSQSKLPNIAAVVQGEENASQYAFSLQNAKSLLGVSQIEREKGEENEKSPEYERLWKSMTKVNQMTAEQALKTAKEDAHNAHNEAYDQHERRIIRVKAAAASALVALGDTYNPLSVFISSMMHSIKSEENFDLQKRSAAAISALADRFTKIGKKGPVAKIVKNLSIYYCEDTSETPLFSVYTKMTSGIVSLSKDEDIKDYTAEEVRNAKIERRGAKQALELLATRLGSDLFDRVPKLKDIIETPVKTAFQGERSALPESVYDTDDRDSHGQQIVDGLSVLRALVSSFHKDLHQFVLDLLPFIVKALQCNQAILRYAAAKCFATICRVIPIEGFTTLVKQVLPAIDDAVEVTRRQGAVECIYHLIHAMEEDILPYVIFLTNPILGRMSDANNDVRLLATTTFATLIKLIPLEAGIPDPPGFSEELLKGREKERQFMAQMLEPKKASNFDLPVSINAQLRHYQQEGVNWLAFLNRYNLHGILCDDMGLGKTLQTLCMVASDHHLRAERYSEFNRPEDRPLPSLIICPPTLSGHWQQEIRTYAPFLKAVAYVGPPGQRGGLRSKLTTADIVITSYNVCLHDNDVLAPINWNYCVLDEGHLIKNPKTKMTQSVKKMLSNHRLILTGTPIQNNVVELWSLFDFLMPGFLGTEKVFNDRFAKPIAASRGAKANSKEQETGALAIEALHKQVLPFLLRRLKEEVLNDLPPKIIQNYYCDLSDLQRRLFDEFTKRESQKIQSAAGDKTKESKQHIFQALQYMRKLCNSPALAITSKHKRYDDLNAALEREKTSLRDPQHAPKLTALKDLLVDCGIGSTDSEHGDPDKIETVSQHRALIFCQMKEMLDMVQTEVFGPKGLLPSVQFMRLDGGVESSKRQDIVNRFNSDPSYDVLLLTTSVGGLGLNLTGADTVIFVEHDWNPQKDMQAMDRAHRIGQKKVVNVYRIVTRGTLEEKILKYDSPIEIRCLSLLTFVQSPALQDRHCVHSRQPAERRPRHYGNRPNPRSLQHLCRRRSRHRPSARRERYLNRYSEHWRRKRSRRNRRDPHGQEDVPR
jgi:TATA-binding protein-associated factor